MGFQDRDYYQQRDDRQDAQNPVRELVSQFTVVHYLIVLNALVWLICIFTPVKFREETLSNGMQRLIPAERADPSLPAAVHTLDDALALRTNFVTEAPWNFWQLLTYGFVHEPFPLHLVLNMLALWYLGREVESRLGNREFLAFYLVSIVMAGLASVAYHQLGASLNFPKSSATMVVGASGAVTAVLVAFGYMLGNRKVPFIFGQVPAWGLAAGIVGFNLVMHFVSRDNVAHDAHLGGAAFGLVYCGLKLNFTRWLPERWFGTGDWFAASRPEVRLYDPDPESEPDSEFEESLGEPEGYAIYRDEEDDIDQVADRLLDKVHREGASSLSSDERQILEEYSRRMRNKRGR